MTSREAFELINGLPSLMAIILGLCCVTRKRLHVGYLIFLFPFLLVVKLRVLSLAGDSSAVIGEIVGSSIGMFLLAYLGYGLRAAFSRTRSSGITDASVGVPLKSPEETVSNPPPLHSPASLPMSTSNGIGTIVPAHYGEVSPTREKRRGINSGGKALLAATCAIAASAFSYIYMTGVATTAAMKFASVDTVMCQNKNVMEGAANLLRSRDIQAAEKFRFDKLLDCSCHPLAAGEEVQYIGWQLFARTSEVRLQGDYRSYHVVSEQLASGSITEAIEAALRAERSARANGYMSEYEMRIFRKGSLFANDRRCPGDHSGVHRDVEVALLALYKRP